MASTYIITTYLAFIAIISCGVMYILISDSYLPKLCYNFMFEHHDFELYKEVLKYLKKGNVIPMYPIVYFFGNQLYKKYTSGELTGYYFLVTADGPVLYDRDKLLLTRFDGALVDHLALYCHPESTLELYKEMAKDVAGEPSSFINKYIAYDMGPLDPRRHDLPLEEFVERYIFKKHDLENKDNQ